MNLHNLVANCVATVNPWITASIQRSTGYLTDSNFAQGPSYAPAVDVLVQVQALQFDELKQLDSLNIQGIKRAIYLNGDWHGLVRTAKKGGDLITLPDGSIWLAVLELENWSMTDGWTKLAIVQQLN